MLDNDDDDDHHTHQAIEYSPMKEELTLVVSCVYLNLRLLKVKVNLT